jgi:hypothetical protein
MERQTQTSYEEEAVKYSIRQPDRQASPARGRETSSPIAKGRGCK